LRDLDIHMHKIRTRSRLTNLPPGLKRGKDTRGLKIAILRGDECLTRGEVWTENSPFPEGRKWVPGRESEEPLWGYTNRAKSYPKQNESGKKMGQGRGARIPSTFQRKLSLITRAKKTTLRCQEKKKTLGGKAEGGRIQNGISFPSKTGMARMGDLKKRACLQRDTDAGRGRVLRHGGNAKNEEEKRPPRARRGQNMFREEGLNGGEKRTEERLKRGLSNTGL